MKNLKDLDKDMEKYGSARSDRFEFEEGPNKVRILNFPAILATHFIPSGMKINAFICVGIDEGCPYHGKDPQSEKGENYKNPTLRLVTYVIDRRDGKVKLAEIPLSVRYALKDLQEDEDFEFADFPMPYDVKITSDPKNADPKAKYRVVGSPNRTELTPEEMAAFDKAMADMTPEQYVEKRKAKAKGIDAAVAEDKGGSESSEIKYPEEEINPEDIPF